MNIKTNIEELKYLLAHTPDNQNIILTGRHGIGKSEILTEIFSMQGMRVVTLFLGQMSDAGDLIGLPDKSGNRTIFRPPYWFPEPDEPIVLFLDELNRARPEILQAVMDLTLNRKLAGRALPKGSRVIAAVNEGMEYQLTDLDPALVSRFNVVRFEPSVAEWLLWARLNGVDARVIGFIEHHNNWLDGDPTLAHGSDTGLDKTPDRRAWKRVSDVIKGKNILIDMDFKLVSSIIGVKAASAFMATMRNSHTVTAQDFFANYSKVEAMVNDMELHELAILHEDIFQFIQTHTGNPTQKTDDGRLITAYVKFLQQSERGEAMANFASYVTNSTYRNAVKWLQEYAPNALMTLMTYIADFR